MEYPVGDDSKGTVERQNTCTSGSASTHRPKVYVSRLPRACAWSSAVRNSGVSDLQMVQPYIKVLIKCLHLEKGSLPKIVRNFLL